jgi:uncharacterized Fe-S cluster-containing radical SAM superfamily protein
MKNIEIEVLMTRYGNYLQEEYDIDLDEKTYKSRVEDLTKISGGNIEIAKEVIKHVINSSEIVFIQP